MFKEGSEPNNFRDELAEELKETPKEERKEILEQAKETPEYQIARNKKLEGKQEEEVVDDGLGVYIKHKTLYHGSATPGIEKLNESGETTVGYGLYLTSKAKDAIGYSSVRMGQRRGGKKAEEEVPTVYECLVENLKLADLRNDENLQRMMPDYRIFLKQKADEIKNKYVSHGRSIPFRDEGQYVANQYEAITNAIKFIDEEKVKVSNIQSVTISQNNTWNEFWSKKGYDGVITLEGGEGAHRVNHDSYVIFDPEKVKIVKEQKIKKEK